MIALTVAECDMPLTRPFRVASFTLTSAYTVVARVSWQGLVGYGESAPLARYGDSVASIMAYFATYVVPPDAGPFSASRMLANVPRAARCALDVAMWDLRGKVLGVSVGDLLGLEGLLPPPSSLTVPIEDDLATVIERVHSLGDVPAIKVKVGAAGCDDVALIEAIRSIYTGAIRIDANEGWTAEQSVRILHELARFGVEWCEQPIKAGQPHQLRWIAERSSIPLIADEDAVEASQLQVLHGCVYGINVKLAKCGGLGAAQTMIATARALNFKVMIGCMAESSILATAAAHIAPLADWLDIDGPTMLAHDPFSGVRFEGGTLVMPHGPGLGVAPIKTLAIESESRVGT